MKDFADVLIEYMKKNNDTQYGINKKTGVSLSTVNDIVLRKKSPTQRTIQKICDGLNIPLSEFYDDKSKLQLVPTIKEVTNRAENMALSEEQKKALVNYKKMTPEKQQDLLDEVLWEKFKNLPTENRKALENIINSLYLHR